MVHQEVVFCNDKFLGMRAYVENHRVDTQQTQEKIGTTNCGKSCSCPWQPRSEEDHDGKEQERGGLGQSDCNH